MYQEHKFKSFKIKAKQIFEQYYLCDPTIFHKKKMITLNHMANLLITCGVKYRADNEIKLILVLTKNKLTELTF